MSTNSKFEIIALNKNGKLRTVTYVNDVQSAKNYIDMLINNRDCNDEIEYYDFNEIHPGEEGFKRVLKLCKVCCSYVKDINKHNKTKRHINNFDLKCTLKRALTVNNF